MSSTVCGWLYIAGVGSAMHEVITVAMSDGADAAHRARRDHHALGFERARRDRCPHVVGLVAELRHCPDLLEREGGFMLYGLLRPAARHQVSFYVGVLQHLEQAHAEYGARGAGDADDEPTHGRGPCACRGGGQARVICP